MRKELTLEDHSTELVNLSILNLLKHPNIIELLASYRHGDRSNLIFPLARGGDLASLLLKESRSNTLFNSGEATLIALAGLASALEHVHDFVDEKLDLRLIGCHFDFRPRNILVSEETLMLADFGLSRFKDAGQESKTMFKQGTDSYLAPECENLDTFEKSKIGRSSDIWSFGCILAEIMIYMESGPQGVELFKQKRAFKRGAVTFAYFHCGNKPNTIVEETLDNLEHVGPRRNRTIVPLVKQMLSLNEAERPKAKEVMARLGLVAISEVAESISELYAILHVEERPVDVFIQKRRFDAWKIGLGVTNQPQSLTTGSISIPERLNFDEILHLLNEMRDCLRSMSSPNGQTLAVAFRRLARLNDCLVNLLDAVQQVRAKVFFSSVILESQFSDSIDKSSNDPSILALDRKIRMRIALKTMTELAAMHAIRGNDKLHIRPELIRHLTPFGNHHVGKFSESGNEHSILVEWRSYGRQETDPSVNKELFIRLECITELLSMEKPEGFCSLPCRGFFHDVGRCGFGVVYDLPFDDPESSVVTLESLINDTKGFAKKPLLEDQFTLASILANAMLEFHMVGWLHKDLTSSNIVFRRRNSTLQSEMVRKPYIIGFNHSRPDEPAAFTEGPSDSSNDDYQHPTYRRDRRGYKQQYDYYSLGVILVEIGFWSTLGKWKGEWEKTLKRTMSSNEVDEKLLNSRASFLGRAMGSAYQDAVTACLTGDFGISELPHDDRERKIALQLGFQRLVVDRLRRPLG